MGLGSFCSRKENSITTLQPKSLRITGSQKGFVQNLEIYQSIQTEDDLDEVSYVFPSDNNLCIYSMKFQVGEEIINAELRSNQAAEETFKEAKKAGFTVARTEKIAPGITEVKIGNVPKNKVVAIMLQCAFISTLQNPTTILTKIPLQATEPDGSVTDLYNLPSLEINIELEISHLQPISDVYANCESNYIKSDDCNGKFIIQSCIITDENILIMTELAEPVQSQMIQANQATLISFIPEFESIKSDMKEYVFLIDCSASMLGESMRKAKESLHLFLSKIPSLSYFNIIRFGTTYEKLFEESCKKVKSTIEKAANFIDSMRANLGGTEMLSMLDELFKSEVKIGCQRQIFVITDGEVYMREKVTQKITENCGYNRIFAIGLGHGADAGFLDEIATVTSGKSDFVFNKEDLPSKVAEQIDLSLLEAASNAQLHIEGVDSFEVVPYPLPPLLPGVATHLFVHSEHPFGDLMITAKAGKNGDEIESIIGLREIWVDHEQLDSKSPIFALFAWNQLKRISNDKARSISLSLSSGVLCDHTSYIAVSANQKTEPAAGSSFPMDEMPAIMYSLLEEPAGGMHKLRKRSARKSTGGKTPRKSLGAKAARKKVSHVVDEDEEEKLDDLHFSCLGDSKSVDKDEQKAKKSKNKEEKFEVKDEIDYSKVWKDDVSSVNDVIRFQSRDGFWDLPSLFITKKCNGKQLDLAEVDLSESPIIRKRVISTVFTLAYLTKFYGDNSGRWRFTKEKGLKWLNRIDDAVDWEQMIDRIIPTITK